MFEPSTIPRLFAVPLGVDFSTALMRGLGNRTAGAPPHILATTDLYLNTERMRRRVRDMYLAQPVTFTPNLHLVTQVPYLRPTGQISDLHRMLEIAQLVQPLLDAFPDLAPSTAAYDLAGSLGQLMDEMAIENVPISHLLELDVSDESGHWARSLQFMQIVERYFRENAAIPMGLRQRQAMDDMLARWAQQPPTTPVIVAGSTGSRGTTFDMMQAVARLPQGAIILPGFDFDMPPSVWKRLVQDGGAEDHPQYRYAKLLHALDLTAKDVQPWVGATVTSARTKLVSLALRPAPVTHHWLKEGPKLENLETALENVTWLEAPDQRTEALTIAARLRKCLEQGHTAAVITPDRTLARRISTALSKWDITPDDSAGLPLHHTPPGRFLLHLAELMRDGITMAPLLTMLKHPLTHTGADRGPHLKHTRDLELYLRRKGTAVPTAADVSTWAEKDDARLPWAQWVIHSMFEIEMPTSAESDAFGDRLTRTANQLSAGPSSAPGTLWDEEAGRQAKASLEELQAAADAAGQISFSEFHTLLRHVLQAGQVRQQNTPHPDIKIWGALEARVQGADLVILAGLNEGTWPEGPSPDPWLNRRMRKAAGLLLPDRNMGLSAHDFQIGITAPQVWVTRSLRSADAETVPARWLNRIENLMNGLAAGETHPLMDAAKARGQSWMDAALALEAPIESEKAKRPAPCPPVHLRPNLLPVTGIARLVRDPYAVYARYVLKLRPLNPMVPQPDGMLRGNIVHDILEAVIEDGPFSDLGSGIERMISTAQDKLADLHHWSADRRLWLTLIERNAPWFVAGELLRQRDVTAFHTEIEGKAFIPDINFTLTAKADRIDMRPDGAFVYDYKTGSPPTKAQQEHYDKQLLLEVEMLKRGAFDPVSPHNVLGGAYIGMGKSPKEVLAIEDDATWTDLIKLITAYQNTDQPYTARRALLLQTDHTDYDHLSRYGEWDTTDPGDKAMLT